MKVDVGDLADKVRAGERAAVGRAITLVESTRADHRKLAGELLDVLTPQAQDVRRIGITGVPGVGKSTFIDSLGTWLTGRGHKVAVVAVDPSSQRSGGSILGDKTRMARLAVDENAFIRASPTAGTLGGVARATRSTMVVLAAAGYDVILVETVGVGQSETTVAQMTDSFLLLALARTGDQLQGIKKGVLELADVIAVNKADGPHEIEAKRAARELEGALRLMGTNETGWNAPVLTCSGLTDAGLDEVWDGLESHLKYLQTGGRFERLRAEQQVAWMWATVRDDLDSRLRSSADVKKLRADLEAAVRSGELSPVHAADRIVAAFLKP
ncbi:methylmalonyl Co-A mutase-associated GTPase MeaB [Sporichthya sp.]|uniref:methylmalonyl Co-A mutase-associated GTPase MeaB n=1 Tax=Sporichthya sp. TaxID=65475 RepID=UPI0017F81EAA|nr:methylmalonyl Co-A mutase-associated GTPase MeaB [Sporichthya sp.]MBA3744312.1 methylmalonyl Co-A mutase-associated GTPase MeaB [Sporichthya sp.]